MATGFFVIFSIIAGAVGTATSMMGIQNITSGTLSNLASAASSSIISWALILLAMGLACKEISIGWRPTTLKTLETLTIITSGTQLLCTAIINAHLQTYDNSPPVTAYPTSVYGERV
ncbi:AWPM-19-like protein [Zostera marina]|uniref:AWPM-19-like protein n=1 Tax=Zostera marina TaxID=29655 RepID=A0A0K9P3E9_ZOSMR|nr:AWPM-19-like protein [Zostera marina]